MVMEETELTEIVALNYRNPVWAVYYDRGVPYGMVAGNTFAEVMAKVTDYIDVTVDAAGSMDGLSVGIFEERVIENVRHNVEVVYIGQPAVPQQGQ